MGTPQREWDDCNGEKAETQQQQQQDITGWRDGAQGREKKQRSHKETSTYQEGREMEEHIPGHI